MNGCDLFLREFTCSGLDVVFNCEILIEILEVHFEVLSNIGSRR
jgi:hypothetical protein